MCRPWGIRLKRERNEVDSGTKKYVILQYPDEQKYAIRGKQGGSEFREVTSAKWIFDVEIEKSKYYNCVFIFPELTFHDFMLAPHRNIYISAKSIRRKKSTAL
jgi:hypothetical protein